MPPPGRAGRYRYIAPDGEQYIVELTAEETTAYYEYVIANGGRSSFVADEDFADYPVDSVFE